jgi:hypothetical protein
VGILDDPAFFDPFPDQFLIHLLKPSSPGISTGQNRTLDPSGEDDEGR